ncbi:hypothetical protein OG984_23445 [Nocardioides sp. NBC_00368]|uniref:hypothetical protein n=1 Tax=Nocardioides sp. NBC_00368 TaxID=2976000 RepID=UPI002E1F8CDD
MNFHEVEWETGRRARLQQILAVPTGATALALIPLGILTALETSPWGWLWMLLIVPGALLMAGLTLNMWDAPARAGVARRLLHEGTTQTAMVVGYDDHTDESTIYSLHLEIRTPEGAHRVRHFCSSSLCTFAADGRADPTVRVVLDDSTGAWMVRHD